MQILINPNGFFVAYIADDVQPAEGYFALPILVAAPITIPLHDACQLVDGQWVAPTLLPVPTPPGASSVGL